jgi:predicted PurR-regulated permease PerM
MHSIIIAFLLASFFGPVHRRLLAWLGHRPNAAALLSVVLVFMVVVVPISVFTSALVKQGIGTVKAANEWVASGQMEKALTSGKIRHIMESKLVQKVLHAIKRLRKGHEAPLSPDEQKNGDRAGEEAPQKTPENGQIAGEAPLAIGDGWVSSALLAASKKALEIAGTRVLPVLSATWGVVVGFLIMLFVLFFAFRDGDSMLEYLRHLSPLARTQEDALLARVRDTTRAVVLGTGITAIAQGVAAMIAFKIVGIPALFWGAVLGASSIVPAVGTALVWVPAVGYLLINGRIMSAAFLAAWCAGIVGSIDNFLRPYLMGGRVGMSSMLVFFAILGGIQAFGPIGILYGPLVFGLCAVCLYIYEMDNTAYLDSQERS